MVKSYNTRVRVIRRGNFKKKDQATAPATACMLCQLQAQDYCAQLGGAMPSKGSKNRKEDSEVNGYLERSPKNTVTDLMARSEHHPIPPQIQPHRGNKAEERCVGDSNPGSRGKESGKSKRNVWQEQQKSVKQPPWVRCWARLDALHTWHKRHLEYRWLPLWSPAEGFPIQWMLGEPLKKASTVRQVRSDKIKTVQELKFIIIIPKERKTVYSV